jgi:hypothetical protein
VRLVPRRIRYNHCTSDLRCVYVNACGINAVVQLKMGGGTSVL